MQKEKKNKEETMSWTQEYHIPGIIELVKKITKLSDKEIADYVLEK